VRVGVRGHRGTWDGEAELEVGSGPFAEALVRHSSRGGSRCSCHRLTARARLAGSNQYFHAGFASIEATKKNAATPTASTRYPVAAPSPTTTSRKHTNGTGGCGNRSMIGLFASLGRKSISASILIALATWLGWGPF
jgi:hypothetical protein